MEQIDFEGIRCRVKTRFGDGIPIILLHGYSFTIDIWKEINLFDFLESKNIPYIALDMPYGRVSQCSGKTRDAEYNIRLINYAIKYCRFREDPVIVGASLGGYIALKYALKYQVSGLILIAPVYTYREEFKRLWNKNIHILVIYGTKDKIVSFNELKSFVNNFKNGWLEIYKDASHPAYLDYPVRFKNDIYSFYRLLSKSYKDS